MRNAHRRYMCYPSVVCTGKKTKVTIVPRDPSRIFREERQYEVAIVGLRDDMFDYHAEVPYDCPYEVADGCLHFTYTFESEQEYQILVREKDQKAEKLPLYAVEKDLYERRPLKGDLHSHSYYSDGADGISVTPADYREEGFDFFALTDHNRMFTSELAREQYDGIPLGIHIMQGEEVHGPGTIVHVVHIGGKESVCEKYINNPDEYERGVTKEEEKLSHIPEQYRHRMAILKWISKEIKKAGGLSIFPHPFWFITRYNVSKDLCNLIFDEKLFDAFELVGGVDGNRSNLTVAAWREQLLKGNNIPVVGSSDSHNHDFDKSNFGRHFSIVFAKSNTTEDILSAIRDGYSVAVQMPFKCDNEASFYSSDYRYVAFAEFLFENYFNETWRLCIGEGILMRRYAEGEDVGDILASLADTTENFYKRFYGLLPSPVVTQRVRSFLDRCLERQKKGPLTKGTKLSMNEISSKFRRE